MALKYHIAFDLYLLPNHVWNNLHYLIYYFLQQLPDHPKASIH